MDRGSVLFRGNVIARERGTPVAILIMCDQENQLEEGGERKCWEKVVKKLYNMTYTIIEIVKFL